MMKVDIWSDVRCPFCYIGKHKFEKALESFANVDQVDVEWHSFELDPYLTTDVSVGTHEHLAANKGISIQQAKQMADYASGAAAAVGLQFDFEHAVVANSFQAHRLIQFAKTKGLGSEAEELLFKAHFTEGKNIDDQETLLEIGITLGLEREEVKKAFSSDAFAAMVREDEVRAANLGINGVPFFVFNDKYAVSGAQQPEVFLGALEQSWDEWIQGSKPPVIQEGNACSADGNCK